MIKTYQPDEVSVVYLSELGKRPSHSVSNLVRSGSLIDPDTADYMDIAHVEIGGKRFNPIYVFAVFVSRETGKEQAQSVFDLAHSGVLVDPALHLSYVEVKEQ